MPQGTEGQAPLSVRRAFVVHFRVDSDATQGRVAGRVEHVASGQVTYFSSLEELLAFMGRNGSWISLRYIQATPVTVAAEEPG